MEQKNRLEQNRYSKPFVGLSTAQEVASFIAGNDKEKPSTCAAATKVDSLMETLWRNKRIKTQMYHKIKKRQVSECFR